LTKVNLLNRLRLLPIPRLVREATMFPRRPVFVPQNEDGKTTSAGKHARQRIKGRMEGLRSGLFRVKGDE